MTTRKNGVVKTGLLDDLLALSAQEVVELPGAKFKLIAKALSAAEMQAIFTKCLKPGKEITDEDSLDNEKLELLTIQASICDNKGRRIPESKLADLKGMSNVYYQRLQAAALKVNALAGDTVGND